MQAAEAVRHLRGALNDGLDGGLQMAQGLGCYVLGEDLLWRGYAATNLLPGVRAAGYGELTEMMTERYNRVLGAL